MMTFLHSVYENKKLIYRGLNRFEGIVLKSQEEAIDFINTSFMMMPLYEITLPKKVIMPQYGTSNTTVSLKDLENDEILSKNFILRINDIITKELPQISKDLLDALSKTFFSESPEETPFHSELLKIIYHIAVDWRCIKKDKGAESLLMSWLNVARVNFKFYGYNFNIIDELYKTTIEEDL